MPRSLIHCARGLDQTLGFLETAYGKRLACHDAVGDLCAMVEGNTMEAVFQHGLHEFLTEFINRNNHLTTCLSESYNFY